MTANPIAVTVEVEGNLTTIDYHSPLLAPHVIDQSLAGNGAGGGEMRRLLCASAAGCYAGSVAAALESRGAKVHWCRGLGRVHATDDGRPIGRIEIRVEVAVEDDDLTILDHVRKILAGGCLVTRALAPAIDMSYEIIRVREDP